MLTKDSRNGPVGGKRHYESIVSSLWIQYNVLDEKYFESWLSGSRTPQNAECSHTGHDSLSLPARESGKNFDWHPGSPTTVGAGLQP